MKINLCWLDKKGNFDALKHTVSDHSVIHLDIKQKEGEIATARLHLPIDQVAMISGSWAWISVQTHDQIVPLFQGHRVGPLDYETGHVAVITLQAIPPDWREQTDHQVSLLPESSVCFEEDDHPLASLPLIWHFHPTTHEVSLQGLMSGTSTLEMNQQIIRDSFQQKLAFYPFESITVEVVAEWIQEREGTINLLPLINCRFPNGIISTLTPQSLIQTWPKEGMWVKRSGYFITKSHLEVVPPPSTGGLNVYPTLTKKITIDGHPLRFRRYWLSGVLEMDWQYRQKRRQKVVFIVKHDHQHVRQGQGESKKIVLKVRLDDPSVSQNSMDSYFDTPAGKSAILKAFHKSTCFLAASARNLRFKWWMPFNGLVTLDQMVRFKHPFHDQWIEGKLVEYSHRFTIKGWLTQLTVAVTAGIQEVEFPQTLEIVPEHPVQGSLEEDCLGFEDFVEYLEIRNGVEEQIRYLQETGLPQVPPTQITLIMKDLRSKSCLEQVLKVATPLTWSGPNQFNVTI